MRKLSKVNVLSLFIFLLAGCTSLPALNPFADDDSARQSTDPSAVLSEQEQAKRDALLAGKSSRPSLKSLALLPVRMQEIAIPTLSLAQKKQQYEALLPLINDPTQKQQVAFRLADINMLLAEQSQAKGDDLEAAHSSLSEAIEDYRELLSTYSITLPVGDQALSKEQQALNRKQMDAMYQLSRALDLSAQSEQSMLVAKQFLATFTVAQFNATPYHFELYFRVGEYYFNRQQYEQALNYYGDVVKLGKNGAQSSNNFYAISAYMLGWSHFKLDQYSQAMEAFATMLDASLVSNNKISASDLENQTLDQLAIGRGDLRLVKDALRVMALTFSYQGNGDAISAFFKDFGRRDYEHLLYDELAQQHLDNDRFADSANVLFSFAEQKPLHPRAIEFFIRHIDAYVLGGFPSQVLLAKEAFVTSYSVGGGVINNLETPIGRAASPYLRQYLKELAQTEHSIAQAAQRLLAQRTVNLAANDTGSQTGAFVAANLSPQQSRSWATASDANLQSLSQQAYTKAKGYYQNYIRTFSPSPEIAPLHFYLAEALLGLSEYEAAIEAFENYAYFEAAKYTGTNSDAPKAVEAAYAALLVYQEIAKQSPSHAVAQADMRSSMKYRTALSQRQQSQVNFIESFATDPRAPKVALNLMQDLFAQQNYLPAQQWATWILTQSSLTPEGAVSPISANIKQSAMLVMAHSNFAMQNYAKAERDYRALLAMLIPEQAAPQQAAPQDARIAELRDRLAASLYKQAEGILVSNNVDTKSLAAKNISRKEMLLPFQQSAIAQALELLQKVLSDTPLSEFRMASHYDSAVYYSLLEKWPQAIASLLDFKARYPNNPLSKGIDDKLYYAYQQTQDWPSAARILLQKYTAAPKSETGRLALYQAAEYYEKAGDRAKALDHFRTYAHQFPLPMAGANEARFILSEFYKQSNEGAKRRFWLNKLVQAHKAALQQSPQAGSARSAYLASMAGMVFAVDADDAYTRIKLTQPLDKSLNNKQRALNKAILEYESVISFATKEFVTAANFKLANLYNTLAQDLMDSDRPKGLSALELSQYEILLEEQAYPFEETAIGLHEKNIARLSMGLYDEWIKESFEVLKSLMPARYNKPEVNEDIILDDL